MRKRVLGFTLIELMIVIAIIAIIAAIAIPGLLRARMSANEGSASASLRSMASAQASFAKANSVDQDRDGQGEYGTLNEMTGLCDCRTFVGGTARRVAVGDLSVAMGANALASNDTYSGLAAKSGYYYHLYLPGIVTDQNGAVANIGLDWEDGAENATIQQQENRWICYSWPATFKSSGMRAFVCDNSAEVYASANIQGNNQGVWDGVKTDQEPLWDAAMSNDPDTPTTVSWTNIAVRTQSGIVNASHLWVPSQ